MKITYDGFANWSFETFELWHRTDLKMHVQLVFVLPSLVRKKAYDIIESFN